jgi:hypothetical protein
MAVLSWIHHTSGHDSASTKTVLNPMEKRYSENLRMMLPGATASATPVMLQKLKGIYVAGTRN